MSTRRQHNRLDDVEETAGAAGAEIRVAYFDPTGDEPDLDGDTPTFITEERLAEWEERGRPRDLNVVVTYTHDAENN